MFNKLLGNSAVPQYVKIMAAGMLGLTYLGALFVEGVDLVNNIAPPQVVTLVVGVGISTALTAVGLHTGAQLGESMPNPPTSITLPLPQTQAQLAQPSTTTNGGVEHASSQSA